MRSFNDTHWLNSPIIPQGFHEAINRQIEAEAYHAYEYAIDLDFRFHGYRSGVTVLELERVIARSPKYSYLYARNIINGRFRLGEATIAADPEYAYYYARDIIRFPWPEAEHVILRDPHFAARYRIDVVQRAMDYLYFDDLRGGFFDNFYSRRPKPKVEAKVNWAKEGF